MRLTRAVGLEVRANVWVYLGGVIYVTRFLTLHLYIYIYIIDRSKSLKHHTNRNCLGEFRKALLRRCYTRRFATTILSATQRCKVGTML